MKELLKFRDAVEVINRKLEELPPESEPGELYEPVRYIIKIGGKRLRPVLVLLACNVFTDEYLAALDPALGVELFHNFTLLHDDIMDESTLRRNHATVHNRWNRNIAILSGDAMSIMSYQLVASCSDRHLSRILDLFSRTALQVCEGQQHDMNYESSGEVSTADYLHMIELKTAVLIAASTGIGAILGDASEQEAQLLYEFGKNIGLAFQIRDDYLDVYGDAQTFGKKIGQDILANKKTYLLTRSLELAGEPVREELLGWMSDTDAGPDEKIQSVRRIYDQLGMQQQTAETMNEYYNKAFALLGRVSVPDMRKTELIKLVNSVLHRNN